MLCSFIVVDSQIAMLHKSHDYKTFVLQWSNGKAGYFVRTANSSWVQEKWSSSVLQFDPNTWIIEYRLKFLMENARPISAGLKFLKLRLKRELENLRQEFWLISASLGRFRDLTRPGTRRTIPQPTWECLNTSIVLMSHENFWMVSSFFLASWRSRI